MGLCRGAVTLARFLGPHDEPKRLARRHELAEMLARDAEVQRDRSRRTKGLRALERVGGLAPISSIRMLQPLVKECARRGLSVWVLSESPCREQQSQNHQTAGHSNSMVPDIYSESRRHLGTVGRLSRKA